MIDQSLRSLLLADSTITALIASNGVYPQKLPQDVAKPCVVYRVFDGMPDLVAGGSSALTKYTVDLTIYSETYFGMRVITKALVSRLHGLSDDTYVDLIKGCRVHNTFNDFEETLNLYSATIDCTLTCKEN
jgi:hypothetical protein